MSAVVDVATVLAHVPPPAPVTYTDRDAILYAVSVGASALHHVYERHPEFAPLPTLLCALTFKGDATGMVDFNATAGRIPGMQVPPSAILHGEEYVELLAPLPSHGAALTQHRRTLDCLDKGSGALLVTEIAFHDQRGRVLARVVRSTFVRGAGGFGGRKKLQHDPRASVPAVPAGRAPDSVLTQQLSARAATLYRLTGDSNPLHVDPAVAQSVGFAQPILHGLCTFGHAVTAIVEALSPQSVVAAGCRFSSPGIVQWDGRVVQG